MMDVLIVNLEGERQQWTADEVEITNDELIIVYDDQITRFFCEELLQWEVSSVAGAFDVRT